MILSLVIFIINSLLKFKMAYYENGNLETDQIKVFK